MVSLINLGVRSSFGLFTAAMSAAQGRHREIFAFAMAIQNLAWDVRQPLAGVLADRYGPARVLTASPSSPSRKEQLMATREEWLARPLQQRLDRLARTPDELADAIDGRTDATLSDRPGAGRWSAKEVICHLRDIEELSILRFHTMLVMDDPLVFVAGAPPPDPSAWGIGGGVPFPLDPDRWADERQYLRNDATLALEAFRRRRREGLAFLGKLTPVQWDRGCVHPAHGRVTFRDWTAGLAGHDDNHLAQLRRALDGRA